MINLYPFLFRFGVSFNYSIPKEIIHLLIKYFALKYHIDITMTLPDDSYDCIAINDIEAQDYTPILAYKFTERLLEYNVTDFENSILFLDFKQTYSDKFIDSYLIPELIKIKTEKSLQPKSFPNFILFFSELEMGSLTYDKLFIRHSNHKILDYCFIFDIKGNVLNSDLEIVEDLDIQKLISNTSTSSLERFQFKLVRKINHFKRFDEKSNAWVACQQFFYEGINCEDEAFQLIKDELLKMRDEGVNPHYIVYDSMYSGWLATAIETVANNIASLHFKDSFTNFQTKFFEDFNNLLNLCNKEDDRNKDSWSNDNELEIIFISDLINTGNTFKERIKKVYKKFPNGRIHCLSALVTDVAFEEYKVDKTDRKIIINEVPIRYFKKVEQLYVTRAHNMTNCYMCKHQLLPAVETSKEINESLSSYEMWLMSQEAGYKLEDYLPRKSRAEERVIPDSLRLFKRNGTLLAIKFEQHLKLSGIYPSTEIAILFPDETKNDIEGGELPESIEKTPSGYFAKCLSFYNNNFSHLGIPRKMIRLLEEANANWNDIKKLFPKILKQIEDIDKPIVIIDEVNFTGKTFKTITDILHNQGKSPVCYFPIFNFDTKGTSMKYDDPQYESIKFLNLYEINLYEE